MVYRRLEFPESWLEFPECWKNKKSFIALMWRPKSKGLKKGINSTSIVPPFIDCLAFAGNQSILKTESNTCGFFPRSFSRNLIKLVALNEIEIKSKTPLVPLLTVSDECLIGYQYTFKSYCLHFTIEAMYNFSLDTMHCTHGLRVTKTK